jgi:hypothetical protein
MPALERPSAISDSTCRSREGRAAAICACADWLANYELIEGVPGLPTAIGRRHGVVRRHLRCGDRHQRFWWQDVLRG